ncbi:MAG: secretin N-terminal domain-containing protein [Planctomycetota bacterium]
MPGDRTHDNLFHRSQVPMSEHLASDEEEPKPARAGEKVLALPRKSRAASKRSRLSLAAGFLVTIGCGPGLPAALPVSPGAAESAISAETATPARDKAPCLELSETTLDFGEMLQAEKKSRQVVIRNTGEAPLAITKIHSTCGCGVLKVRTPAGEIAVSDLEARRAQLVIDPASLATLDVELDAKGKMGEIDRKVEITSNDPGKSLLAIALKAHVRKGFALEPAGFEFGPVKRGERPTRAVTLTLCQLLSELEIVAIETPAPWIEARVETVAEVPGEATGGQEKRIEVAVGGQAPLGLLIKPLLLRTSDERVKEIVIPLSVEVVGDVSFRIGEGGKRDLLDFGLLEPGRPASRTIEVENVSTERPYRIRSVSVQGAVTAHATATLLTLQEGFCYRIVLAVEPGLARPFFRGVLRIEADHPDLPVKEIPFRGWVRREKAPTTNDGGAASEPEPDLKCPAADPGGAVVGTLLPLFVATLALQEPAKTILDESIELARLVDLSAARLELNIQYDAALLKGTPTLRLAAGLSDEELWILTNRLLALYGFASMQMPGEAALHIVKLEEAASAARVETDLAQARAGYLKVLRSVEQRPAAEVLPAIKLVLSKPGGSVQVLGESNRLLIADLRPHLEQALAVLSLLDTGGSPVRIEVLSVRDVRASVLVTLLTQIATTRREIAGVALHGKVFASPSDDSLILLAPPEEQDYWRDLIAQLDRKEPLETRRYPSKRFPAQDLAKLIEEILRGAAGAETSGLRVLVDATGALLVKATAAQHREVAALMERLESVPIEDPVIEEIETRFLEPTGLVTLLERIAVTRATVQGKPLRGKVLASPRGTRVLLVSPPDERDYWCDLIARLDTEEQVETVSYAPARFAVRDVARLIEQVVGAESAASARFHMVTDELTGSLIVTAPPAAHARIRELLDRLEQAGVAAGRTMRSFVVRNRPAGPLVEVLNELVSQGFFAPEVASSEQGIGAGKTPQTSFREGSPASPPEARPAQRLQRDAGAPGESQALLVSADQATNTLIAVGEGRSLDQLEELIRKLDVREAQVLVEVLVATLSESDTLDLGMELQRRTHDDDTLYLFASLFGLGSPALVGDSSLPTDLASGFSGVVLDPGEFSILLRAFQVLNQGRSLTIPKLLVNNNEQAVLNSVLQNPFSTTSISNTVATTSFGGTQDAGTTVTVRPQIAEGDHPSAAEPHPSEGFFSRTTPPPSRAVSDREFCL